MSRFSLFPYVLAFVLSVLGTACIIALAVWGGEVALLAFIAIALIDIVIALFVRTFID